MGDYMSKMRMFFVLTFLLVFALAGQSPAQDGAKYVPGATEETPSRAHYFSWINNTNEGATEKQTLTNLNFFKWLHDEYGMQLDIYAFDAGAIDGANFYGSMDSQRFKRQFPHSFDPICQVRNVIRRSPRPLGRPRRFRQYSRRRESPDRHDGWPVPRLQVHALQIRCRLRAVASVEIRRVRQDDDRSAANIVPT